MIYFKQYVDDRVLSELGLEEVGLLTKLKMQAAKEDEEGLVVMGGRALDHNLMSLYFNTNKDLYVKLLAALEKAGEIRLNNRGILILKWRKHQSEYIRRRAYYRQRWQDKKSEIHGEEQREFTDTSSSKNQNHNKNKTYTVADTKAEEVLRYYCDKVQKNARHLDAHLRKIKGRLRTYTADDLKKAVDKFSEQSWWMSMRESRGLGASWFFASDKRIEQFINLKPERKDGLRDRVD